MNVSEPPDHRPVPLLLGNLPLPEAHLALLGVGIVLQAVRPLPLPAFGGRLAAMGAGALMGAATVAIVSATQAAGRVDLAAPDRLVTRGPYALTRHPMYEAWTAIYAAVGVALRNGWLAALLPLLLVLVHRETSREDARLRERFGAEHARYAERAPRYLTLRIAEILRSGPR
jgi:protein-S-isoprenylcysteine O-methyltransferase Ste14